MTVVFYLQTFPSKCRQVDSPDFTFPGQEQMKPEQLEIERLRREVTKLNAERNILKNAAAYVAKESL